MDEDGLAKDEDEEDELPKTPIPQKWECLNSDKEIKEYHFRDQRSLVYIQL